MHTHDAPVRAPLPTLSLLTLADVRDKAPAYIIRTPPSHTDPRPLPPPTLGVSLCVHKHSALGTPYTMPMFHTRLRPHSS